ncbi:MAG: hypothetical protein V1742_02255, partial [Pseudomonadota bacterium]
MASRMILKLSSLTLVVLLLIWAAPVAAVNENTGAPPELGAWKPWVLHGLENRLCPAKYNNAGSYRCTWPSRLKLTLDAAGGKFVQEWLVLAPTWVPLPGGSEAWPQDVSLDGALTVVVSRQGTPAIRVEPGEHRVEGLFYWSEMPRMLKVPAESGLVSLTLAGSLVTPQLDEQGRLWLQKRQEVAGERDELSVNVSRLINDAIPMQVTTNLKVTVSGQAREIALPGILLKDSIPMSLKSPLPARLTEKELTLQARPGTWEIWVVTRFAGPVAEIGPVEAVYGPETWAFQSQNHLRLVRVEGVPSIDPSQTSAPSAWKQYPTYLINPKDKFILKEIKRGDPAPAPDRLELHRTWWLDFNGLGLTVQDKITGTLSRHWSLALNPPGRLGRVTVDGQD